MDDEGMDGGMRIWMDNEGMDGGMRIWMEGWKSHLSVVPPYVQSPRGGVEFVHNVHPRQEPVHLDVVVVVLRGGGGKGGGKRREGEIEGLGGEKKGV